MFSRKDELQDFTLSPRLYSVWIRAHEGANTRLVLVWIDRDMSAFEASLGEASTSSPAGPMVASAGETWTVEDEDPGATRVRKSAASVDACQELAMAIDSFLY